MNNNTDKETGKRHSLQRMKMIAGGALVLCVIMMVVCRVLESAHPWLVWPRAFFEAGMVGALADWFAVTALFRHPMGLKIPHTRILPNNKNRIGNSLGDFVVGNFLSRDVVEREVTKIDLCGKVADYLDTNSKTLSGRVVEYLPGILNALEDEDISRFLQDQFTGRLRAIPITPVLGRLIELLTSADRHSRLADDVLNLVDKGIHANGDVITEVIRREIPIPDTLTMLRLPVGIPLGPVKDLLSNMIATEATKRIQRNLAEVRKDPEHKVRLRIREQIARIAADLKESPEMIARGEEMKTEFLANPNVSEYANRIWQEIKTTIIEDAESADSQIRQRIGHALSRMARQLHEDEALRSKLNTGFRSAVVDIVDANAPQFGRIIRDTVNRWDGDDLARKLELEMGRDLQFVRLNGTLVGGLVGVLIYGVFFFLGK